jgi:hypothetical protein
MKDVSVPDPLWLAVASHYDERAKAKWYQLVEDSAVSSGHHVDWSSVYGLALANGLGPLIYAALSSIPAQFRPLLLVTDLKRNYLETAAQNTLAIHDLVSAVSCLHEAGTDVVLLKGAALLNTVYDNLALRPMFDIDLLVNYTEFDAALAALARLGYSLAEPEPFPNLDGLFWNEILLEGTGETSVNLELHWNLLDIPYYASRLSTKDLMSRAQRVSIDQTEALCLAPVDQLLHLCAHSAFHHLGLLWRTEVDVAFVAHAHAPSLDWDHLIDSAVEHDLVFGVQQTILRAAKVWRAPIPKDVLIRLRLLKPTSRERAWIAWQRSEILKVCRTFVTLPSIRQRYFYAKGQFFPSRDYLSFRYGISPEVPGPLAYTRRFLSGMQGLIYEVSGRERVKQPKDKARADELSARANRLS